MMANQLSADELDDIGSQIALAWWQKAKVDTEKLFARDGLQIPPEDLERSKDMTTGVSSFILALHLAVAYPEWANRIIDACHPTGTGRRAMLGVIAADFVDAHPMPKAEAQNG